MVVNLGTFGRRVLAGLAVSAAAGLTAGAASATPTLWADNGHYYEFVGVGLTFDGALNAAASATPIAGYESYLATITSAAENTFIADLELAARGTLADTWVAGSDREVEGVWRWIAGPEAGQIFWIGGGSGIGGAAPAGAYANWENSVEPNNNGDENAVSAFYAHDGGWNDFNGANQVAYVVEYSLAPPGPGTTGVPEPASWALMILGFGGAGAALRKRRRVVIARA